MPDADGAAGFKSTLSALLAKVKRVESKSLMALEEFLRMLFNSVHSYCAFVAKYLYICIIPGYGSFYKSTFANLNSSVLT
jgi:hypothetical protein